MQLLNSMDNNNSYWKLAPGERASNWDIQRDKAYIGIGWPQLGNMINASRAEYDRRRMQCARELGRKNFDGFSNVWTFIHEISIGDIIIANRGISLIVGVGIVTGNATYTEDDNNDFPTRRAVDWKYVNNNGCPIPMGKFAQATLTRISNQEIIRLGGQLLNHDQQPT
jgi:hypothetical protein